MNKLNPIYILALMVTLFIISILVLDSKKQQYHEVDKKLISLNAKAQEYKEYKTSWFHKQRVIKKFNAIVQSRAFRGEKILKTQNETSIRVRIESMNPKVLNKFLNRVLNEKFLFKKLDIKKQSISFEVGFK